MNRLLQRAVLSACLALPAFAASAAAPIPKIQPMLAKPSMMCGRFDQTKHLAGMKKPLVSQGRFCVVAPCRAAGPPPASPPPQAGGRGRRGAVICRAAVFVTRSA